MVSTTPPFQIDRIGGFGSRNCLGGDYGSGGCYRAFVYRMVGWNVVYWVHVRHVKTRLRHAEIVPVAARTGRLLV